MGYNGRGSRITFSDPVGWGSNPKTLNRFALSAFLFYFLVLETSFCLDIKQKTPHFREGFLSCQGSRIRTVIFNMCSLVGCTRIELVTSCLSSMRSKPTELAPPNVLIYSSLAITLSFTLPFLKTPSETLGNKGFQKSEVNQLS